MYFYQETNPFLQKRAFEIKPVSSCFQALYQNKTDANWEEVVQQINVKYCVSFQEKEDKYIYIYIYYLYICIYL